MDFLFFDMGSKHTEAIKGKQFKFDRPLTRLSDYFIANYFLFTNRFAACTLDLVSEYKSN